MNKNEKQLQEQEAPLKNTDNAFVKVSNDGSPDFSIGPSNERTEDSDNVAASDTEDKA